MQSARRIVRVACLVVLIYLTLCCRHSASQCNSLTRLDLTGGLLAEALLTTTNNVTILDYNLVCLSTSGSRDRFSTVSVVAEYRMDSQNVSTRSQFEFECDGGVWVVMVPGSSNDTVTTPPDATLNTTLRTDCSRCLKGQGSNNSQHCQACVDCEGLNLCTLSSCCNVFDVSGQCAEQCPPNAVTNSDSTCSCRVGFTGSNCTTDINDCVSNPCQNGGSCSDRGASDFLCNCASGFGGSTCQDLVCASPCQNGGTCALVNGNVTCSCAQGFEGSSCQDVVSSGGCGTTCFIVIIAVVVGLILFVTIAVVVVTTVTALQKDKKIKKYNVQKKKKRRKKASSKGKNKKSSMLVVPKTLDAREDLRNQYSLQNLQSQPAELRVTMEPLRDNEMEAEGTENEGMERGRMGTETMDIEGTHTAFERPAGFETEGMSMDMSDF